MCRQKVQDGANFSRMFNSLACSYTLVLSRGLQTTARGPNAAREVISSGPWNHFVNDEKIIYSTYEKFVDLVEYNISRNNHIAHGVRPSTCSVLPHVALGQKSLETPVLDEYIG